MGCYYPFWKRLLAVRLFSIRRVILANPGEHVPTQGVRIAVPAAVPTGVCQLGVLASKTATAAKTSHQKECIRVFSNIVAFIPIR